MKKRTFILALATALALLLAACGNGGGSTSGNAASTPPAQPASQAQPSGEASIKGTVVDASMNTVTIQVPNGSEYSFATEGAEISSPAGLMAGDEVTIHYTGTFDESTQAQEDVTVSSIFVDAEGDTGDAGQDGPTGADAGNTGADAGSTAADAGNTGDEDAKALQGTIEQYDGGNTMMVVDATGVDFLFSLDGADLHVGEEGFAVGDEVIVYYFGNLVDQADVQDVTVGEVKKADQ